VGTTAPLLGLRCAATASSRDAGLAPVPTYSWAHPPTTATPAALLIDLGWRLAVCLAEGVNQPRRVAPLTPPRRPQPRRAKGDKTLSEPPRRPSPPGRHYVRPPASGSWRTLCMQNLYRFPESFDMLAGIDGRDNRRYASIHLER
jgi:hypothetical protein